MSVALKEVEGAQSCTYPVPGATDGILTHACELPEPTKPAEFAVPARVALPLPSVVKFALPPSTAGEPPAFYCTFVTEPAGVEPPLKPTTQFTRSALLVESNTETLTWFASLGYGFRRDLV